MTEEKFNEIKDYLDSSESAMTLFEEAAIKPCDGRELAGKTGVKYSYVRKVMGEFKSLGIVRRDRSRYLLTNIGIQVYRRLKGVEEIPESVKSTVENTTILEKLEAYVKSHGEVGFLRVSQGLGIPVEKIREIAASSPNIVAGENTLRWSKRREVFDI